MDAQRSTGARSDSGTAVTAITYTVWLDNPTKTTIDHRVRRAVFAYRDRNQTEPNVALIPAAEFATIAIEDAVGVVWGANARGEEIVIRPAPFSVTPGAVYVGCEQR